MNTNEIWILNPDYKFKSDLDRICLYSTKDLSYDSMEDWTSYIHPFHAIILHAFNGDSSLSDIYTEISSYFNINVETIEKLIRPFLGNKESVFSEFGSTQIFFPKNLLIPKNIVQGNPPIRDIRTLIAATDKTISLAMDRAHKAPHSILWMLTNKCVTNCAYCYADKKTQHSFMSTDKCLKIIDEASRLGVKFIDVIGGEVFLRKDWDILIKKMVCLGMSPSYISTKMPVSSSILDKLLATGYKNAIQVSLDSMEDSVLHNTILTSKGYLEGLLNGIHLLDKHQFQIQVNTVLTRKTATIYNLKALAAALSTIKNFVYWEIRVPEYTLYSSDRFSIEKCSKTQLEGVRDFIMNSLSKEFHGKIIYSDDAVNDTLYCTSPSEPCFKGGQCGFLQNQMFILPDGKVSVCEQLYWHPEFIIGDLTTNSIDEIWQSDKALTLFNLTRQQFRKESICSKCGSFDECTANRRRCAVKVIKAYGANNWDYPDPRCKFAPPCKNEIEYI